MKKKEMWIVFLLNGRELAAYTVRGKFAGELEETKNLLAYENGVLPETIEIKKVWR